MVNLAETRLVISAIFKLILILKDYILFFGLIFNSTRYFISQVIYTAG
jgi:hypothetical protein